MLQSKHSEAFLAVAESGSFEQAALRLNITASAVTLRVQTLEKQLGQVLIIRERPCKVTQAGQEVLLFLQHHRLMEQNLIQNLQGQSTQSQFFKLNIASNADSLTTWLLPTIQQTLITEKIVINLKIDDQTQTHHLLEAGLVNACISTEPKAMKGCEAIHLGKMNYQMVATPTFIEKYLPQGVHREILRHTPAVIFNDKDQVHAEVLQQLFGLMPSSYPCHFIPSTNSFVDAILLGLGYGMVPEMQIQKELATGQLLEILPKARTDIHLYWHHWKQQSKQLDQLTLDLIQHTQTLLN
jgi:LysR family transcriptional regulator, chromosome initiation inhibitor